MKRIDVEELKKIQVGILDYFDAFCKKNSIHYWLDYGTLLGAIRHKGFIPWDDDVDITMLREDYEKAAQIFNKQGCSRYVFQTPSNFKDACYPFGKLIDTSTILYEYGETGSCGTGSGSYDNNSGRRICSIYRNILCHAICDRKCSAFDGMGDCEKKRSISIWGEGEGVSETWSEKSTGI